MKKWMTKTLWNSLVLCFSMLAIMPSSQAQLIINEVSADGRVELKNAGSVAVNAGSYWLYSFPNLRPIVQPALLCDSLMVQPGGIITMDTINIDPNDGEMALFAAETLSSENMTDYVEWGRSGHFNAPVAIAAGVWQFGDFVMPFSLGQSIEYDGNGDASVDWYLEDSPSLCSVNIIGDNACSAFGGEIFTGDDLEICLDQSSDFINFNVGGEQGQFGAWVICDAQNNILENDASFPYDFENGPSGSLLVRYVAFDSIQNLQVGLPLQSVRGCFRFSNVIEVRRQMPNGGLVLTADGDLMASGCEEDLVVVMDYLSTSTNLEYYYILVDAAGEILDFIDATVQDSLDLSGTGAGQVRVFGLSGKDIVPPNLGDQIDVLTSQSCADLSSNVVVIDKYANTSNGGNLMVGSSTTFCVADNRTPIVVERDSTATGEDFAYFISDAANVIRVLQEDSPLDIDSLSEGRYHIYSIAYQDVENLDVGAPLDFLSGCYDLSDPELLIIEAPRAGELSARVDGLSISRCAGNATMEISRRNTSLSMPYYLLLTSATDTIVDVYAFADTSLALDLSHLTEGQYKLYGWVEPGENSIEMGKNVNQLIRTDCNDLSAFGLSLSITPNPNRGGMVATPDHNRICLKDSSTLIDVFLTGAIGDSTTWVIVDLDQNIVQRHIDPPFDLDGIGKGSYELYHMSYGQDLVGIDDVGNLADLENCYDLSNAIPLFVDSIDGGQIFSIDSLTTFNYCSEAIYVRLEHASNTELLPYAYLVVDGNNIVQAVLDDADGPFFPLNDLGIGTYKIYGWSHTGAYIPDNNTTLASLEDFSCQALSSNTITLNVLANTQVGGTLSTASSSTICVDEVPDFVDLTLEGAQGIVRVNYVITDTAFNILEIPDTDPPYDVDNGIEGSILIWNMANNGALFNLEVGSNFSDIVGCYGLSNPIRIDRVKPDGGRVQTTLGETDLAFCAGTVNIDLEYVTTTEGLEYSYLVTDVDDIIQYQFNAKSVNNITFNNSLTDEVRIYGWAYDGNPTSYIGQNISALNTLTCSALSENYITVSTLGSVTNGGQLLAPNIMPYCSDGVPDPVDVILSGAIGQEQSWIITDEDGRIISLPFAPPFNLDPAGDGLFYIYNIAYESGIEGLNLLNNISDLRGCFDLSNAIEVVNSQVFGGLISTSGSTNYCKGSNNNSVDLNVTGGIGQRFAYIVTDESGVIRLLPTQSSFSIESLEVGQYSIYHAGLSGVVDQIEVGNRLDDIEGCHHLSDPLDISIVAAEAERVTLSGGEEILQICRADAQIEMSSNSSAAGFEYRYVLTTADDNIVAVFNTPDINLSGLAPNEYKIYGWTYQDNGSFSQGADVTTLNSGCRALSDNFVFVRTQDPDGSDIVSSEGATVSVCIDGVADQIRMFNTSTATALQYVYLVADINGNVLAVEGSDFVNVDQIGGSTVRIYGYSYGNNEVPQVGDRILILDNEACGSLSNNFITIIRQAADGGTIISDMGDKLTICKDTVSDNVLLTPNTAATSLDYYYILTNTNNKIAQFTDSRIIDLNTLDLGETLIYGWSTNGLALPAIGDDIAVLDQDCGDLSSNFISVTAVDTGSPCSVSTVDLEDYGVSVYPNPTIDQLNLAFDGNLKIVWQGIFDLTGMRHDVPTTEDEGRVNASLAQLPSGTYVLSILIEDKPVHALIQKY